jgi:AcrR family transcriptional regulator
MTMDPAPIDRAADGADPAELPLGDRLVQVALELLAEEGVEALTLRSVARRAGVSHGAPARHFANLADLLAEVAAAGFRSLSEAIEKSGAALPPEADPRARLAAGGRAYLDCALANPGLFALMFRKTALNRENEALERDSSAAFERLLDLVRGAQAAGWHAGRDPRRVAGAMWASMHGLATLWVDGTYAHALPDASLEDALTTLFELAASPADTVPDPRPQGDSR